MMEDGGEIHIGKGSTFEDAIFVVSGLNKRILIGDDCMFSSNIDVRTGDDHAVVDLLGNKLNHEKDVTLKNHVWVAPNCSILKGVQIGAGSIIATRSTVTRPFQDENILIGGSPAKKLKDQITWVR